MYLASLTIQGFKSFAEPTRLDFLLPRNDKKGITAVVGPNGSGKSNIADAVRWVLGEQSMKTLRGKKTEDVIFAGSDKRARLGFAEVSLLLHNLTPREELEMSEIEIARRLYRSGESEYLINNKKVRLHDVALLLARAHFGERSYSVIGQGMVDHFLIATPQERKMFLDEAAGVKEFQLKRRQAFLKLQATEENMNKAQLLLDEVEPRLKSLRRQVHRLEQRASIEKEWRQLQEHYYGSLWRALQREHKRLQKEYFVLESEHSACRQEYDALQGEMARLEKEAAPAQGLLKLQRHFEELTRQGQTLREEFIRIKSQREINRLKSEQRAARRDPAPMSEVIARLEELHERQKTLIAQGRELRAQEEWPGFIDEMEKLRRATEEFVRWLKNPRAEKEGGEAAAADAALEEQGEETQKALVVVEEKLKEVSRALRERGEEEKDKRSSFFALQKKLQSKQDEARTLQEQVGQLRVELAKVDTRREALENEMRHEMNREPATFSADGALQEPNETRMREMSERIDECKRKLALIGGVDEEVLKEHKDTEERYEFLKTQSEDLRKALSDLYAVVSQLDERMQRQRDEAFKNINREFARFFKMLFGGGNAELQLVFARESDENEEEGEARDEEEVKKTKNTKSEILNSGKGSVLAGIEIRAVPPGKRINSVNTLSGGERAMTAIALICAILYHNPSPFVILDEVDAALDEFNSARFAHILSELAQKTQFICITHNRATMQQADVLYGITMGNDGISHLLSVKMEEALEQAGG